MSPASATESIYALIAGMFRASMNQSLHEAYVTWQAGGGAMEDLAVWLAQTEAFDQLYTLDAADAFADELTSSLLGLPSDHDFAAADAVAEFRAARDWVAAQFAEGKSPGQIAYSAISALLASSNVAFLDAQLRLQHQSIISQYYVASGGDADSLAALQAVLLGVTADSRSLHPALATIDLNATQAAPDGPYPGRFNVTENLAHGETAWINVDLVANHSYVIQAAAAPESLLDPAILTILGPDGLPVAGWANDNYARHAAQLTITPVVSGTYQIGVGGQDGTAGKVSATLRDVTETSRSPQWQELALNTAQAAMIDAPFSRHEFSLDLAAHQQVDITLTSLLSAADPLMRPKIFAVRDPEGHLVSAASVVASAFGGATLQLTANTAGTYKLTIGDSYNDMGAYRIEAVTTSTVVPVVAATRDSRGDMLTANTELPASLLTTGQMIAGASLTGKIDTAGDVDWIRVNLEAAHRYDFAMQGLSTDKGTLADPYIVGILNSSGELLRNTSDDDSGTGLDAQVGFVAPEDGDYYLAVQGYGRQTGSYTLSLDDRGLANPEPDVEQPIPPWEIGKWTVMVFMAADNDLESFAMLDLKEMEAARLPADVSVVVGIDRTPGYETSNGNWTDTRVGVISHDPNNGAVSSPLSSVGEVNTGNPATLAAFIDWAVQERPAEHYALVVWNHGDGINGVAFDASSGNDSLSFREIRDAIAASIPGSLDLVGFDACSMAFIEQAAALDGTAGYMVASQELEPGEGWDYAAWLNTAFQGGSAIGASALADAAVDAFQETYADQRDVTLSALALTQLPSITEALGQFIDASNHATQQDWAAIRKAYFQASYFSSSDSIDLKDFADLLQLQPNLSPNVSIAAAALDASFDTSLITITNNMDHTHGLSIYWPSYRPYDFTETYAAHDIPMLETVQWDAFLQSYWGFA